MRTMTLALGILLFYTLPAWETDFSAARKKAKEEHKYILLNFSGSDWCIPCIRMHRELFGSPEFSEFASKNLVLVNADFPRLKKNKLPKEQSKQNDELADKYNPRGDFPLTLLLDKEGSVIKKWEGYPDLKPEQFVNALKSSLNAGN